MKTLLIGGARSGKSSLAERWALERADRVHCIVTARASDAEMAARIAAHRERRPRSWSVVEAPVRLGTTLREVDGPGALILIDCLTVWTANCLWPRASVPAESAAAVREESSSDIAPDREHWRRERESFLGTLRECASPVIIVSNEVGTGVIPINAAARTFVDEQGWLNQSVASVCDQVFQVTAGIAVRIKPER